ncbi:MAG: hypothetical protein EZS28_014361 [Streblomastix strix]|uniref:Uncharacterized protein n=1 Tax=Streblomastix strix TaxID=222440 RepID=A0A5J4W612_9EUKA|nr:MAG: hypothetical protein EZS28_014361 [Streblomastix strix]
MIIFKVNQTKFIKEIISFIILITNLVNLIYPFDGELLLPDPYCCCCIASYTDYGAAAKSNVIPDRSAGYGI